MMGQFPNCEIKLCDLEISRVILDGSNIREILGTPDYVGKSLSAKYNLPLNFFPVGNKENLEFKLKFYPFSAPEILHYDPITLAADMW